MVIHEYGIVIWNCAEAISLSGLHIHFFMPLPHFYPTMAFCKTTMALFFLTMAQIYVFGTFWDPIKRVTLFRHVLWTQIWVKVMLWCGTVILRCGAVIHFFMTSPHYQMSTPYLNMTTPHRKWLWHIFGAWVIPTYGKVITHMYLFILCSLTLPLLILTLSQNKMTRAHFEMNMANTQMNKALALFYEDGAFNLNMA